MRLWIERSASRRGWLARPLYHLTAGVVCDAATLALIERHRLGGDLVWMSPSAEMLAEAAEGLFDNARELPLFGAGSAGKSLRWNARGLVLAWQATRELRVRVADLIDGIAIESRALGELRAAEAGIRAGFDELVVHLEALARYDDGDEILIEPTREDRGTPSAGWVRMAGRG